MFNNVCNDTYLYKSGVASSQITDNNCFSISIVLLPMRVCRCKWGPTICNSCSYASMLSLKCCWNCCCMNPGIRVLAQFYKRCGFLSLLLLIIVIIAMFSSSLDLSLSSEEYAMGTSNNICDAHITGIIISSIIKKTEEHTDLIVNQMHRTKQTQT